MEKNYLRIRFILSTINLKKYHILKTLSQHLYKLNLKDILKITYTVPSISKIGIKDILSGSEILGLILLSSSQRFRLRGNKTLSSFSTDFTIRISSKSNLIKKLTLFKKRNFLFNQLFKLFSMNNLLFRTIGKEEVVRYEALVRSAK